jgi:hypothetical protein
MTDEQEQMLQAVLRNQEVIMNALAEILTNDPAGRPRDLRRSNTVADLGTCVGLTHYYLADLKSFGNSEGHRRSEN